MQRKYTDYFITQPRLMEKTFLLLVSLFTLASVTNAQEFYSPAIVGHIMCRQISYQFNLTSPAKNLSVKTYFGDGQDTTTQLHDTQTHAHYYHMYPAAGTYTTMSVLYNNNTPIDTITGSVTIDCSYVMLQAYMDNNSNCSTDFTDGFIQEPFLVEIDSAGIILDTVTVTGYLLYKTTPGVTYKFREFALPPGTNNTCPSNGVITLTTPTSGFGGYALFGHNCVDSSKFDLGVNMFGMFRPVNNSMLTIRAYNNGCGARTGTITLNLSNKYKYKSATPSPNSVNGQTISWVVNNLSNTNSQVITLIADTATKVNLNDTVCNTATITPISGDVNVNNNTITRCDEVRAAWDPNDKGVYPAGDILPGTKLTYTINFENLGNDTAFNIHILDTLSEHLDPSTLNVISSSHAMNYLFVDNNINKAIAKFDFVNIHLADSNSKKYNKGYVQFSVKVKDNLPYYTQINNRAGIYFDISPVVLTNYTENRITAPQFVEHTKNDKGFAAYPNPVKQNLNIRVTDGSYDILRIYNGMGQIVTQQSIDGSTTTINTAYLPAGIYYLHLTGKENTVSQKIVKQ